MTMKGARPKLSLLMLTSYCTDSSLQCFSVLYYA